MTFSQNNLMQPFKRILIIGTGVMGGSFIKSLSYSQCQLYAIECNEKVRMQVIAEQPVTMITYIDLANLEEMDLVIITVMPSVVIDVFWQLQPYLSKHTLVIEISGIKQKLVAQLNQEQWNFNYVSVHPMAGRENGGYAYSRKELFINANFLLICDGQTATTEQVEQLKQLLVYLGTTRIFVMTAKEHDEQITYTSQLSHILASSLLLSENYADSTKDAIGDSFRDLTRIANMNVPMWRELFLENKELLVMAIDNLIIELSTMKTDIVKENVDNLTKRLTVAKNRRNSFDRK